MHLRQSLLERLAQFQLGRVKRPDTIRYIMEDVDRFLRHNGHERAANVLHTEHMP